MSKGNEYVKRREYVTNLNLALSAFPDHEGIAYVNLTTGKEYVKIWDRIGGAVYLDVTQMDLMDVFHSVATCMRAQEPKNILTDITVMRSLVPLFKQEVERQEALRNNNNSFNE